MPDIRDDMPERSFLPRSIVSKLPFSTSRLDQLKQLFHASHDSVAERVLVNTLTVCERDPSPGETKRCVGSIEDMIDFSISVLGPNVVAQTTENTNGSGQSVMIGNVVGLTDGNITKSVSCHQRLYPYLLYYCHSVPKVKVYSADILDVQTKVKINNGIAICHLDTSEWIPGHEAFLALKSSPGLIEVCHWIFENEMNWTVAYSQ
ncbi:polygalacturonase non-catalytic subunit AroGP2-like [Impatiens glandulifera]|uniref:polygalacturonase non-catalytic subunit AroGP2-like n=1 Tax=Impatiens glandulifera TaxID=253017 RepID=UPI001FB0A19A|nr:polygalacturonase non-catalytic subunit AroGP2-like [Impatiens glandulifera]